MHRRYLATATAAALLLAGGGVLTDNAFGAAPAGNPTTMSFTAQRSGVVVLGKGAYTLADTDVQDGKRIGVDILSCTDASGKTAHCKVAFAVKGGILLANFTLDDTDGSLTGQVSGGEGAFTHASGKITGQVVSRTGVRIKLVYSN